MSSARQLTTQVRSARLWRREEHSPYLKVRSISRMGSMGCRGSTFPKTGSSRRWKNYRFNDLSRVFSVTCLEDGKPRESTHFLRVNRTRRRSQVLIVRAEA